MDECGGRRGREMKGRGKGILHVREWMYVAGGEGVKCVREVVFPFQMHACVCVCVCIQQVRE